MSKAFITHGYKLENCTFKYISKSIIYSSTWEMLWISHSSISYVQPSSFLQLVLCRQFSLQFKRLQSTSLQRKASSPVQGCDPPADPSVTRRVQGSEPQSHARPRMDLATPFLPTGSTKSLAQGVKYLPGCHCVKMMACAWVEHLSARWQLAEPGKGFLERNGAQLPNSAAMLSSVGGRGEHVWESILLFRWRARRTSALRNLIWEGRRESCKWERRIGWAREHVCSAGQFPVAQTMVSGCLQALATLALSEKHHPRHLSL